MRIPLSIIPFANSWYWIFDPEGGYSVKSCYRASQGVFSSQQCSVWKKIWSLKVPPKVRNFMWRVGFDCLPTATKLLTKHVHISPVCQRCHNADETSIHILFECHISCSSWGISQLHPKHPNTCSVLEWFQLFFNPNSTDKCTLFAMIC